ncbi:MAG: hypothetical protein ACD_75C00155G0001 [uncultured bacterium]|nr:MAG: hypothetical protein ACD_75C00155G0001 [uncultured bacterium]
MLAAARQIDHRQFFPDGFHLDGRQEHLEDRAAARLAAHFDDACVTLDNTVDHRQPETGPLAFGLSGKIGIVNFIQQFGGNTPAGILHPQFQIGSRLAARMMPDIFLRQFDLGKADRQHPAVLLHGLGCIGAEVHNDLVDLSGIGQDVLEIALQLRPDLDRGGQRRAEHFQRFLDQRPDLQRFQLLLALPAE